MYNYMYSECIVNVLCLILTILIVLCQSMLRVFIMHSLHYVAAVVLCFCACNII